MKTNSPHPYKVGYVALVGRPNVGKSTLLNALLGHKVSAVSDKPQTTRAEITAIYEDERGQIFFIDTPGYYYKAGHNLYLNQMINQALKEADLIVFVADKTRRWGKEDQQVWQIASQTSLPIIWVTNKIDVKHPDYSAAYPEIYQDRVSQVIKISAKRKRHLKALLSAIFELLPRGKRNPVVDLMPTALLDTSAEQYIANLIQEKVFLYTNQEVPYQTQIQIQKIESQDQLLKVEAVIKVSRPRYKAILIGKQGRMIKRIGTAVRQELSIATGKKVVVKLKVE